MTDTITIRAEGATVWIGDRRLPPGETCEVPAARRTYYEQFPTIAVVADLSDDSLESTHYSEDDASNQDT